VARLTLAERRKRLLDAATRVAIRDGITDTTTRAITTEAGMPRGTFHYCFQSKDELLEELVKCHVKDMVEAACAVWQDDKSLAENLRAGLQAVLGVGKGNPKEEILSYELTIYALRADSPTMAERQYADYGRQAADYLNFAADKSGVRWALPMPTLARMFATVVDGSMLHWLADQDSQATLASLAGFAEILAALAQPVASAGSDEVARRQARHHSGDVTRHQRISPPAAGYLPPIMPDAGGG
jgi:AcrR family transcriptional regulator